MSIHSVKRVVVLALSAVVWRAASARDWPQWGGSHERNHVSPEKGLPVSFTRKKGGNSDIEKNVKWSVKLGSYTYGNPTVADGRAFVGTAGPDRSHTSAAPCGLAYALAAPASPPVR